ncbi:uncharacterized protein LOC121876044 [Homarus americanus]|uniref:uncharacterized protein LOC121876044 n=1 Tax=Homarus americanus TaxID=6706 RepID=UPI001C496E87|nr:uncharacterized protein LOC121876044 [Homarus americanus]
MGKEETVLYAVLDTHSTITDARWRLVPELLKKDINKDCIICDVLSVRLVLKVGESTCGMEVFCQQKGGTNKIPTWGVPGAERAHGSLGTIPTNSVTSGPVSPHDPTSTAKTTISILRGLDMNGLPLTGEVGLGTKLVLVVSAYCKDVTLDLHLIKCQAKGEDGISIAIVKDGCSVAQVMGEFREVLGVVHESSFGATPVRRVTQYARLDAFNTRTTQQNISIVCTIKMCSGECVEQPSCVQSDINLGKSKRPTVSLFSQVVSLGKAFQAAGLSATPSEDKLSKNEQGVQSLGAGNAVDDLIGDCISYHTLYILICLLTGIHLAILGWCIYCVRRTTTRTVVQSCMEDYESPKRALYTEYSSPRKRTPKSSPEYSSFSISTEAYNSPNYKRM